MFKRKNNNKYVWQHCVARKTGKRSPFFMYARYKFIKTIVYLAICWQISPSGPKLGNVPLLKSGGLGLDGCKCLPGASKQAQATGKPAYPAEVPAYGSGCKAHDAGFDACKTSSKTAAGQADDWCQDQWCFVDKNTCKFKAIKVSYTAADNYFAYETCDASFAGNGWVGRCKCVGAHDNSYCTCPQQTTTRTPDQDTSGATSDFLSTVVPLVISALALVVRQ